MERDAWDLSKKTLLRHPPTKILKEMMVAKVDSQGEDGWEDFAMMQSFRVFNHFSSSWQPFGPRLQLSATDAPFEELE